MLSQSFNEGERGEEFVSRWFIGSDSHGSSIKKYIYKKKSKSGHTQTSQQNLNIFLFSVLSSVAAREGVAGRYNPMNFLLTKLRIRWRRNRSLQQPTYIYRVSSNILQKKCGLSEEFGAKEMLQHPKIPYSFKLQKLWKPKIKTFHRATNVEYRLFSHIKTIYYW